MTRRTIVFVLPDLGLGGAQVIATRLTAVFRHRGDEIVIATLGPTQTDLVEVPAGVRRVPIQPSEGRPGLIGVLVKNLGRRRSFQRLVRQVRPDVVIAFVDSTNLFTLLATIGLRVPVIVSERVDPRMHRISLLQRALRRVLYRRASALVVQTDRVSDWGRSVVRGDRVHVIPNPVEIPAAAATGGDPPTILAAGRLVPQKGFDLLLAALARLDPTTLSEWRTVILGEGHLRASLEEQVRQLGLEDHVDLPGQVPSTAGWLCRSSLFVLSSRFEGFPNALAEAMAWGLPVIAFDCATGPRELMRDGTNGRLVPEGDVDALTAALADLTTSPEGRRRLGEAARDSMQRYAPDTIVDLWDSLIGEVVHRVRDSRRG